MFIKLKQKIKKYYAKILSKKFSGFGIFKFPSRKVLLGVFLMVMIFGGVFGEVGEVRAFSEGDCFPDIDTCKNARVLHNNDPNMGMNEPLLRCVQEGEQYCLRIGSAADIITGRDITGAIVYPIKELAIKAVEVVLNYLGNIIFAIIYFVCWILLYVVGLFVNLAAFFLNATLNPDLYIDMFGPNSTIVATGWKIIRDICNMFFILILLVISLATILRIQTYKAQSLLLPLLIAAFLINFSRPIVEVAIDASQLLMYQFVNMIGTVGGNTSDIGGLVAAKDAIIEQFSGWDLFGEILGGDFMKDALNWVIGIIFALVFLIALCFVYLAMALFMIIRLVALTILIILSPIGFFFNILPQTKSYASKYWSELSKYLIFGPIMAFFIYLASFLAVNVSDLRTELQVVSATGTVGAFSGILQYIIVLVFLYASIWIARQMGIWGADKVEGMTVGKLAAGGAFLGGAVGGYMSRSLAKGKLPWQDTVRGVGRRLGGKRFKRFDKKIEDFAKKKITTDKSGKEISVGRIKEQALGLLSPEAIKRGYQGHIAEEEAEAYGVSSGRMQDLMERTWVLGYKDPTHERMGQLNRVAEEQKRIVSTNPDEKADIAIKARKEGNKDLFEGMFRDLSASGDITTLLEHEGLDNGDPDALREYMEKYFVPSIGEENTAKLAYDMGYLEDKAGTPANRGIGMYDKGAWKIASAAKHLEEATKRFMKKDSQAKWIGLGNDQFFATRRDDQGKEIGKELHRFGQEAIKNLTSADLGKLNRAKPETLKNLKEHDEKTGEISKIINAKGVNVGKEFIDAINKELEIKPKGKGKGTQTPKTPTTETPPETEETKKAYA